MFNCVECEYSAKKESNLKRHIQSVHTKSKFECVYCEEEFSRKDNLTRHKNRKHKKKIRKIMDISGTFDIRLKENFKLFVSGPSRCGKTVFVSKLIENIQSFIKQPRL